MPAPLAPGYPKNDHLQFIQAVLWHVEREGFELIPLPLETLTHAGYVEHAGCYWELSPWLPGEADYHARPTDERLSAALVALARFHEAACTFPLADIGPAPSPGMLRRRQRLHELQSGGIEKIGVAIADRAWPELAQRARRLIGEFTRHAPQLAPLVEKAARRQVELQPCIRDIWHDHVLFTGDQVTGMVDFGALRPDNVATDVSRLLGSLVADSGSGWQLGLAAYESVRPLMDDERSLVTAFDRTTVLMGGLQWLEWIYLERKAFADRAAVEARLDAILQRLARLADGP